MSKFWLGYVTESKNIVESLNLIPDNYILYAIEEVREDYVIKEGDQIVVLDQCPLERLKLQMQLLNSQVELLQQVQSASVILTKIKMINAASNSQLNFAKSKLETLVNQLNDYQDKHIRPNQAELQAFQKVFDSETIFLKEDIKKFKLKKEQVVDQ